jgi:N-methylhydantoinase A
VTDANVYLGRLNPEYFLGGEMELDVGAAEVALASMGEALGMSTDALAMAIIDIVDANMVNAVRLVSIDRGLDPRGFTLFSFGGAGSLHAAALAEIAGIAEVAIPLHQGVLSAFGLMTADVRVDESVTATLRSDQATPERVSAILTNLRERAVDRMRAEGHEGDAVVTASIEMRYLGQNYETAIDVPFGRYADAAVDLGTIINSFHDRHERLYGYHISDEIVELVHFNVTAIGPTKKPSLPKWTVDGDVGVKDRRLVYFGSVGRILTPVYERAAIPVARQIDGPAVIEEAMATSLVHPGQSVVCDEYGNLVLRTSHAESRPAQQSAQALEGEMARNASLRHT